jgi:uncharacterized UPF0146 family protein
MNKILFMPLNQNHVLIFKSILQHLKSDYLVLCHDRISEAAQYHTGALVQKNGLNHRHFPDPVSVTALDPINTRINNALKIRRQIQHLLNDIRPEMIVVCLDNDPTSQILISEAKRRKIKTLMVPEGLLKPHDFLARKTYLSDYIYRLLGRLGTPIRYIKYGSGGCDYILVSGKRSYDILQQAGIRAEKMIIVGQQKYDGFLKKVRNLQRNHNNPKVFLYAASTRIFREKAEAVLVRKLADVTEKLGAQLIVKLHPRLSNSTDELLSLIGRNASEHMRIIKEGYETFDLLRTVDVVITISSAIVLEAMMMDLESVAASYLAGRRRFDYDAYDAIYSIENENEIERVMKDVFKTSKKYTNKKRLLEDEIHTLDGMAGKRTADIIEELIA